MRSQGSTRWTTPFGRFVSEFNAHRLARAVSQQLNYEIRDNTVYAWVAGRQFPRPHHITAIVVVSGGRVSVDDIYQHHRTLSQAGQSAGPGAST